ncbi:hypothetical protein CLD22_02850 [Rubrivivax gelatinosus]|nr:hypothetical protein [Rubrivivax gelatinosus]
MESRAVDDVARAAGQLARTAEAVRKDAKTDARGDRSRDASGRLGSGGDKSGDGVVATAGRLATSITSGASSAAVVAGGIDPVIGAAAEVRDVVAPLGRAASYFSGQRGERDDPSVPWLRKLWREMRGARRDDAAAARATQRGLKDVKEAAGAARGEGGGLLSAIGSLLPALAAPVVASVAGIATKIGGLLGGVRGALAKLPVIGAAFEAAMGVAEDQRIANDGGLTDTERTQKRVENAGGTTGALAGATAGATAGSLILPGVGTVIGGAVGGFLGSKAGRKAGEKAGQLGWVSRLFESGDRGVETISSGRGDRGGTSYGEHQLAAKTGTMQRFLDSSGYGAQFAGLTPGTREFNAKYREIAKNDGKAFADAQHAFMVDSHYGQQVRQLHAAGIDLSGRGQAVKEALFSTATQYGPNTKIIERAMAGADVGKLTDAQLVERLQNYKHQTVDDYFRSSSPAVRNSIRGRAMNEKGVLMALAGNPSAAKATMSAAKDSSPVQVATAVSATVPRIPAVAAVPPVPKVEPIPVRISSSAPAPTTVVAQPPLTQDVRDRSIAYIVTGGIGAPTTFYR